MPFALLGALFGLVFSMTVQNVHDISYSGGKGWQIISTLPSCFLRVELARYVRIDGQVAKDRRQAGQKTTQPLGKIVNK